MKTMLTGKKVPIVGLIVVLLLCVTAAHASDPWADQIISYSPGDNADAGYTEPSTALGEPSRMTGADPWVGAVTPFNGPWLTDQVVSVGSNGHLTVAFDQPITNSVDHLYGVDFIIFGNGFFNDTNWPAGQVGGLFEDGPFSVSVSADGLDFITLQNDCYDAMFPMLGYLDLAGPYDTEPGSIESDFTRPVNPDLTYADFDSVSFETILALYDGSGGGIPFDIAGSGLETISYVRIDVPNGAVSPDFDAFAAVPEPTTLGLSILAFAGALRRER